MGRNIVAGVAGVVLAGLIVWVVEAIGHTLFPLPVDLNFADKEAMGTYVATLPIGAFLFVGGAWFLGALGGTVAACRIGDAGPMIYALVVGGFMLAATAVNLIMIPHPTLFSVLAIAGIIAATWLGKTIGSGFENSAK